MKLARNRSRWIALALVLMGISEASLAGPIRYASAPVPPDQEIEVLDPGVDPVGNPRALVKPLVPGVQKIDIPQTVLVHKFYYTGDRSFQAQLLNGGPVIIAVNHPKTNERVYVPTNLPPGAPRVTYTSHTIRYDFGPQSVSLIFGACGKPNVVYSQSPKIVEKAHEVTLGIASGTKSWVQRTGIPQGIHRFAQSTKNAVGSGADLINETGRMVLLPIANGLKSLPGAQLLQSTPEDKATRARELAQKQLERLPNQDQAFIPRSP